MMVLLDVVVAIWVICKLYLIIKQLRSKDGGDDKKTESIL